MDAVLKIPQQAHAIGAPVYSRGFQFYCDGHKWLVKGVTYGPFPPDENGESYPAPEQVEYDFAAMADSGANTVRLYTLPPDRIAQCARQNGLRLLVDVPWPKHLDLYENPELQNMCLRIVQESTQKIAQWDNVLGIILGNEIPADIVRWHGAAKVERFLKKLYSRAKQLAPNSLIGFANFPSTEYLDLNFFDFIGFNIYLDKVTEMRDYLVRLRHLYPEKPVLLTECGADSKSKSPDEQAMLVPRFLQGAYESGLAGAVIFAWTDEWHTGGLDITGWDFGLVDRDRNPKPVLAAVTEIFRNAPHCCEVDLKVSLVIATYNGGRTLRECLNSIGRSRYQNYEVIVVDDGSTDNTAEILQDFPAVQVITQENLGLSVARNSGIKAASGDIVAFTDSDCIVDPDWLYFTALFLLQNKHLAGVGGPNITPFENNITQKAVALAPGHATHVLLSPTEAEHVPGCNMAFWRTSLLAANGFDPVFRKAGDDVDIIWRLQQAGYTMGFSTAAFVWHHRRPTVSAYLHQQRGYGEAEALLIKKHPSRFNDRGQSLWRGAIYPGHSNSIFFRRSNVQYGIFGSAGYQCVYHTPQPLWWHYATSLEWWLITVGLLIAGIFSPVALVAGIAGALISAGLSACGVLSKWPASDSYPKEAFPLVWLLWIIHPLMRSGSRYWYRLKLRPGQKRALRPTRPSSRKKFDLTVRQYWSEIPGLWRTDILQEIEREILTNQWICSPNNVWQRWDLSVAVSAFYKIQIYSEEEAFGGSKRLLKLKFKLVPNSLLYVLIIGALIIIAPIALYNTIWARWVAAACLLAILVCYRSSARRRNLVAEICDEVLTKQDYFPTHSRFAGGGAQPESELASSTVFPQLAEESTHDNV